jgi:hypothetical protein
MAWMGWRSFSSSGKNGKMIFDEINVQPEQLNGLFYPETMVGNPQNPKNYHQI